MSFDMAILFSTSFDITSRTHGSYFRRRGKLREREARCLLAAVGLAIRFLLRSSYHLRDEALAR